MKTPPLGSPAVLSRDEDERQTRVPGFDPEDLAPDSAIRERAASAEALESECRSAIGSESTILVAGVSSAELKRFALDHVSGFLISLMDGATDVESILDISGLPRLVVLQHLRSLLDRGIVVVASGRRIR